MSKLVKKKESLAQKIALGKASTSKSLRDNITVTLIELLIFVDTRTLSEPSLSENQRNITFNLWNQKRVPLNRYQSKAIKTACSNKFTLIQGPPGN